MKLNIAEPIFDRVHEHLFQDELEQGAFLFGTVSDGVMTIDDAYLIPPTGWAVQLEVYLEMNDDERAKVMTMASKRGQSVVDCHSHPGAENDVWFSPSDVAGIKAFAQYARWKLRGGVYVASVWGESSIDAVVWSDTYKEAQKLAAVEISGSNIRTLYPTGSWFREPRSYHRKYNSNDD